MIEGREGNIKYKKLFLIKNIRIIIIYIYIIIKYIGKNNLFIKIIYINFNFLTIKFMNYYS